MNKKTKIYKLNAIKKNVYKCSKRYTKNKILFIVQQLIKKNELNKTTILCTTNLIFQFVIHLSTHRLSTYRLCLTYKMYI